MSARGFSTLEIMISIAILSIVMGVSLTGGAAHRQTIRGSLERLEASLAASTYLESLESDALPEPGIRTLELGEHRHPAEVETRRVSEGLFEIRVRIKDAHGVVQSDLTTRVATRGAS